MARDRREDPGAFYPGGSAVVTPERIIPGGAVVLDDTVSERSANGVKSSGIWKWVKGLLPSWLTPSFKRPITEHQDISGKRDIGDMFTPWVFVGGEAIDPQPVKVGDDIYHYEWTDASGNVWSTAETAERHLLSAEFTINTPEIQDAFFATRRRILGTDDIDAELKTEGKAADAAAVGGALAGKIDLGSVESAREHYKGRFDDSGMLPDAKRMGDYVFLVDDREPSGGRWFVSVGEDGSYYWSDEPEPGVELPPSAGFQTVALIMDAIGGKLDKSGARLDIGKGIVLLPKSGLGASIDPIDDGVLITSGLGYIRIIQGEGFTGSRVVVADDQTNQLPEPVKAALLSDASFGGGSTTAPDGSVSRTVADLATAVNGVESLLAAI